MQWEGLPQEDIAWVSLQELKKVYPNLDLEDKVLLMEGSNDVNLTVAKEGRQEGDIEISRNGSKTLCKT